MKKIKFKVENTFKDGMYILPAFVVTWNSDKTIALGFLFFTFTVEFRKKKIEKYYVETI